MIKKRLFWLVLIILVLIGSSLYYFKNVLESPCLQVDKDYTLFIETGWGQNEVLTELTDNARLRNPDLVAKLMEKKNYAGNLVVSGKYVIPKDIGINELINFLRAGNGEVEVNVTFNSARTLEELAGKVTRSIEADSTEIIAVLTDPRTISKYGFNSNTFLSMFIPDTYRMEWDTDAQEFVQRMADEYKKFWDDDRKQEARDLGLSQSQVSTLASIVQAEQQSIPEERGVIAGLYLNRLQRGMRLQSDPTVIYAIGDFSITRLLTKDLSIDSPYNTYKYSGLPPGPINVPSKQSLQAVLNADDHNYLYMCAKDDFSGYHAFASNLSEHNRNARAFQRALNERKIYR